MTSDEILKKMLRYQNGGMSPAEKIAFESELKAWEAFSNNETGTEIEKLLRNRKRPVAPPEVLRQYHRELGAQFTLPQNRFSWRKLWQIARDFFIDSYQPSVRFARIAALLIIGIVIGRIFIFSPKNTPLQVPQSAFKSAPGVFFHDVTDAERKQANEFIVDSEMFLLQLSNWNAENKPEVDELAATQEMARQMLRNTFVMKEKAVRTNDLQLLHFISRLELALYEIANLETEELLASLSFLQEMIHETGLLEEAQQMHAFLSKISVNPVVL